MFIFRSYSSEMFCLCCQVVRGLFRSQVLLVSQMINANLKSEGLGNCGTGLCHKQSGFAKKKVVLRDVQNDGGSLIRNDPESCIQGGLHADAVKIYRTEGLTAEQPLNCQSWKSHDENEHVTLASRNPNTQLGIKRVREMSNKKSGFLKLRKYFPVQPELPLLHPEGVEKTTSNIPASTPTPTASLRTFYPDRQSVPVCLKKPGDGLPTAESNRFWVASESEVPHSADSKRSGGQVMKEWPLYVQKPQNHCYEYDQREHSHMFRLLSPVELSRCAVELEKRSIQLSVEEGKEIKRMKALNIFGKSS